MSEQNKNQLKKYFESGDRPTQGQFINVIDSALNLSETEKQRVTSDIVVTGSGEFLGPFTGSKAVFDQITITGSSDFSGSITASGGISSSGEIIGLSGSFDQVSGSGLSYFNKATIQDLTAPIITGSNIKTDILTIDDNINVSGLTIASGIISSSVAGVNIFKGFIRLDNNGYFKSVDSSGNDVNLLGLDSNNIIQFGAVGKSLNISGSVTSSGVISSSGGFVGNLTGNSTGLSGTPDISIKSITSSQNISSSGTITAASFVGDGSGLTNVTVTTRTESISLVTASLATGSLIISGSDTYTSGSTNLIKGLDISGSIIPKIASTMDIGSPTLPFRDSYVNRLIVSDTIIPTSDNEKNLGSDDRQWKHLHASTASVGEIHPKNLLTHIRVKGELRPQSNQGYSLGSYNNVWLYGWVDTFHVAALSGSELGGDASTITVSASLVPGTDNIFDLGSLQKEYKDLYIDGKAHIDTLANINSNIIAVSSSFIPDMIGGTNNDVAQWSIGNGSRYFETNYVATASLGEIKAKESDNEIYVVGNVISGRTTGQSTFILGDETKGYFKEGRLATASLNVIKGKSDDTGDGSSNDIGVEGNLMPRVGGGGCGPYNLGDLVLSWGLVGTCTASVGELINRSDRDDIRVSGSLIPTEDDKYDLGELGTQWKNGYFDGSVHMDGMRNAFSNTSNDSEIDDVNKDKIDISCSLYPNDDGAFDLGKPSREWRNLYIDGYVSLDKLKNYATSEFNIDSNVSPSADDYYYFGRTNDNGGGMYRWQHMGAISSSVTVLLGTQSKYDSFGSDTETLTLAEKQVLYNDGSPVIYSSGSLLPHTHNIFDLGGTYHQWRDLYVAGLLVSGGAFYPLDDEGNVVEGGNVVFNTSIIPDGDNIYDLGNDTNQFKTGHISTASLGEIHAKQTTTDNIYVFANLLPTKDYERKLGDSGEEWLKLSVGTVSASALLHISASQKSQDDSLKVLVRDLNTGLVYYTGSYGTGGGGGGDADNLGNHTATQNLNMSLNNVFDINDLSGSGNISMSGDKDAGQLHQIGGNLQLGDDCNDYFVIKSSVTASCSMSLGVVGEGGISDVSASISALQVSIDTLTAGNSDNLGNHTATQDLNMANNDISNVTSITASQEISSPSANITNITASIVSGAGVVAKAFYVDGAATAYGNAVLDFNSANYFGNPYHNIFGNHQFNSHFFGEFVRIDSDTNIILDAGGGDNTVSFRDDNGETVAINTGYGHITASGDVSASGDLYINPSTAPSSDDLKVLVHNTSTGLVYYTGSYESLGGSGGGSGLDATNGANNRIATFTDSDSLNGEANLTFNGSTLDVTGNVEISGPTTASGGILTAETLVQIDTFVSSSTTTAKIMLETLPIAESNVDGTFVNNDDTFASLAVGQVFLGKELGDYSQMSALFPQDAARPLYVKSSKTL